MPKQIFILSLFAIVLFGSCKPKSQAYMEDGHLTVELPLNALNISQDSALLDSARYTPLETTPGSIVSSIDKIYYSDTSIIIGDFRQSSVLIFSLTGKFIKKLHKQGAGPGEYQQISDIAYRDHQILLWDFSLRKLLVYDESFNLMKEQVILPSYNTSGFFTPLGDKLIFKMDQGLGLRGNFQLAVFDTSHYNMVDSLLPPQKMSLNHFLATTYSLIPSDSFAYYQPYADNYIYRIDRMHFKLDTLCKLYFPKKYQLSHYTMGADFKESGTQKFIMEKNIVCIDALKQWGDILYLSYYFNSERYHVFLNVKNNSYKFFTTHPGLSLNPHFLETAIIGSFSDGLIGFIVPSDFEMLKTWGHMNIDQEANPVVAKFYFKKAALQ